MKKVLTGAGIGLVGIFLTVGSAMAANTISGNSDFSYNKIVSKKVTVSVKNQTNSTSISNNVNTHTTTGYNSASFNGGTLGTVSVGSGSVHTTVGITNTAGLNATTDSACCCNSGDSTNTISGNGDFSYNKIVDVSKCVDKLNQTNSTTFSNSVNTVTNSGGNAANFNNGSSINVTSGNVDNTVTITNTGSANVSM